MLHRFQHKHVFAFYAEIQNGHQKCWENDFGKKLQMTLCIPWGQKFHQHHSISHHFQDKCAFAFYTEI